MQRATHALSGALRPYDPAQLRADLAAGLTTGVVLVPQGMAYAMLAGLPPVAGLYAALAGSLVYPWLGTSRQLSVGPVAMDSIMVASTVGALASTGTQRYAVACALLAALVGVLQLGLGLLRAGFVVNFLSRPVISGFTSAAALAIATSQLGELTRISLPRSDRVHEVWLGLFSALHTLHLPTLLLGGLALLVLFALSRAAPRVPAALVLVTLGIVAAPWLPPEELGLRVVGGVGASLPSLLLTQADLTLLRALLPGALTLALLSYTESMTTATAFARKHHYELSPNRELFALGAAQLAAGVCAGYPVAGGLSRSCVNERAGARTGLASLVAAAVVLASLLLLMPLLHHLPRVLLSAVVLSAVVSRFDVATARTLYRVKRSDFWLLLLTFVATLFAGLAEGVLWGIAASLLVFVVRETRPHYAVLGNIPGTEAYLNVARHPHAVTHEGVLIVRMDAQLYFGNVSFLRETLRAHEARAVPSPRALVLDASGMNLLDSSALEALEELDRDYQARGVRLIFARVKGPVRDVLQRAGMLQRLRSERRVFTRTHDAAECARLYVCGRLEPCTITGGDLSEGVDPGPK